MNNSFLWIFIFLTLEFSSCSLKYEDYDVDQNKIPQLVMHHFQQTFVKKNKKKLLLKGERAERNEKQKELKLQQISFEEYDEEGQTLSNGQAKTVLVKTDSHDAILDGGVKIWNEKHKTTLETESLSWQQKEKRLVAIGRAGVSLTKKDGSQFHGQSADMDFKTNTLKLSGDVKGVWKKQESSD